MPTLQDLLTVCDLPAEDTPNYQEKVDILVWYFDHYLVAAAGNCAYGKETRWYKHATKTIKVEGKNQSVVLWQAEAFGLLVFENCLEKWSHICPQKAKDPNWNVPKSNKKDARTLKYHATKWTDGKTGQQQGGGWKQGAYDQYAVYQKHIVAVRKKDRENQWASYNLALELMRNKHGVTAAEAPVARKNKRKRQEPGPLAPRGAHLELDDDVEDAYSVGSETSSGEGAQA